MEKIEGKELLLEVEREVVLAALKSGGLYGTPLAYASDELKAELGK